MLAGGWLYLYTHSHAVHPESQDAILSQLKDLKQLDSTWNVDVLKSQAGINKSYDPLTKPLDEFASLFARLDEEVKSSEDLELASDLESIHRAIDDKTALIDRFKAENALLKNSLRYVPTVNRIIQDGFRAQRAVALTGLSPAGVPSSSLALFLGFEEDVNTLVCDVLEYNSAPDSESEALLYEHLRQVDGTKDRYPAAVRSNVNSLLLHLRAILRFSRSQTRSLEEIARVPVVSRSDIFARALTKRFDSDLSQQYSYQRWLLMYSGVALVSLFGFGVLIVYRNATERRRLLIQVAQQTRELKESSLTDPLTGLRNRRFLQEHVESDVAACLRRHEDWIAQPLAEPLLDADLIFFLIDIDHFKEVNDTHGHAAGDAILVKMKDRLREVTRDSDYLIRWGGEEFLIVARQANRQKAEFLAERIRSVVGRQTFELPTGVAIVKTCSVGFACYPFMPRHPRMLSWSDVVQLADHEMYRAKSDGRDRWAGLLSTDFTKPETTLQGLLQQADHHKTGHSEIRLVRSL